MLGAAWVASVPAAGLLVLLFNKQSAGPTFAALFTGVWIATAIMWALVFNAEYASTDPANAYAAMAIVLFIGTAFPLVLLGEQLRLFLRSPGRYLRPTNPECGDLISHS